LLISWIEAGVAIAPQGATEGGVCAKSGGSAKKNSPRKSTRHFINIRVLKTYKPKQIPKPRALYSII
jgi:hypothetical protein